MYMYIYVLWPNRRVFANGLGDIANTQKIVLDAFLLNTQHYKAMIKGKAIEKGAFWSLSTKVPSYTLLNVYTYMICN